MNSNVDSMTTLWTVLQDEWYTTEYVHEYVLCHKVRLQQQLVLSELRVHRFKQFSQNIDQALW